MGTAAHLREWLGARGWWAALSRVIGGRDSDPSDKNKDVANGHPTGEDLPVGTPGVGHPHPGHVHAQGEHPGGLKEKKHPFDRKYGVDTDGLIYADADAMGHAGARHNAGYYATAPSLFRGAMELWRGTLAGTGYGVEDYALVDIGCGKGRVLMMAAEYPFREIVGVEVDPGLAGVARRNLSRVGRRRWFGLRPGEIRNADIRRVRERIRIWEGDALTVVLPEGPVALFYFNSFEREMTEMWLQRLGEIARGRTHPIDLIYVHPEFDALVRQVPGMRVIAEAEIAFSGEDAGADVFGVSEDRTAVYRLNR